MSNMINVYILFGMREQMAIVELCVSPVLIDTNQNIWNFYGSLTLNKTNWIF